MRNPEDTAALLVEVLPYIRRFVGRVVVVKYGGNALAGSAEGQADALACFAEDVVLLRSVGLLPVVVHGGGPQIGELMGRLGIETEFRDGLRVTDAATLEIARMVLVGKVNRDIVSAVNVHGPLAVGLSGEDANLITAERRSASLGYVGDVLGIDPTIVQRLLAEGLIPVLATIGADRAGQAYNINADTVAGAVAEALAAEKLIFLTDVEGVRADPADPATLCRQLTADELDALVAGGAARGGMAPKAAACSKAVRNGVSRAHILDGRVPHALLLELFTDGGVGTMVLPGMSAPDRSALMRTYAEPPVTFVRGEGSHLFDAEGRRYLDFISGLAVTSLGHSHPAVASAVAAQARTLCHVSNLYGNELAPEVAATLDRLVGGGTARRAARSSSATRGPRPTSAPSSWPVGGRGPAATSWSRPGDRSTAGPWPP